MTHTFPPSPLFRPLLAMALAVSASVGAVLPAQADYLWLQTDNGQTRAQVGELHKAPGPLSDLSEPRQVVADGKTVPASADPFVLAQQEGAPADQRFAATRAGSDGVLTYYQARFGRQETRAVHDLELVPTTPQGNTYQLMFKGRPVAASQVNVDTSEGWRRVLLHRQGWHRALYALVPRPLCDGGHGPGQQRQREARRQAVRRGAPHRHLEL